MTKIVAITLSVAIAAALVPQPVDEVHFSPNGGCMDAVVHELGTAEKTVRVQAYGFTSASIAIALAAAAHRHVDVQVIADKSELTDKRSELPWVAAHGVPCFTDAVHAIAHNKIMIIDGRTVITGSYNFTNSAELHNAENLVILRATPLASKYSANWELHRQHSDAFTAKPAGG